MCAPAEVFVLWLSHCCSKYENINQICQICALPQTLLINSVVTSSGTSPTHPPQCQLGPLPVRPLPSRQLGRLSPWPLHMFIIHCEYRPFLFIPGPMYKMRVPPCYWTLYNQDLNFLVLGVSSNKLYIEN